MIPKFKKYYRILFFVRVHNFTFKTGSEHDKYLGELWIDMFNEQQRTDECRFGAESHIDEYFYRYHYSAEIDISGYSKEYVHEFAEKMFNENIKLLKNWKRYNESVGYEIEEMEN